MANNKLAALQSRKDSAERLKFGPWRKDVSAEYRSKRAEQEAQNERLRARGVKLRGIQAAYTYMVAPELRAVRCMSCYHLLREGTAYQHKQLDLRYCETCLLADNAPGGA